MLAPLREISRVHTENAIGKITSPFHPTYNINQLKALKKTTSLVKTVSPLKKFTSAAEYVSMRKSKAWALTMSFMTCVKATSTTRRLCGRKLLTSTASRICSKTLADRLARAAVLLLPYQRQSAPTKSLPASGGADFVKYYEVYRHQTTEESTAGRSSMTYSHVHEGTRFHFESEANKIKFIADPVKYVPAYGGFCAFAITMEYCGFLAWTHPVWALQAT